MSCACRSLPVRPQVLASAPGLSWARAGRLAPSPVRCVPHTSDPAVIGSNTPRGHRGACLHGLGPHDDTPERLAA